VSDYASPEAWRDRLVLAGFIDDGELLIGDVHWQSPQGPARALIAVSLPTGFPFAPPRVQIRDAGAPLEVTFHQDRDGTLCLWEDQHSIDQAPWLEPTVLLERTADWLTKTAAGWPGDDSLDLERYLEPAGEFVLYKSDSMPLNQPLRIDEHSDDIVKISGRPPAFLNRKQRRQGIARESAWALDLGPLTRPVRRWADIADPLGPSATEITEKIRHSQIAYLLLRYRHGAPGVLAVRVAADGQGVRVMACESADDSDRTRQLRAGTAAATLHGARVAVVGCGAIGSFAADQLVRSGVRQITLLDYERLRPGNVVRHLAGHRHVGQRKTAAVADLLADIASDVHIRTQPGILILQDAQALLDTHDIVLDATGSARASSLLGTAIQLPDTAPGRLLVSVCVQRAGTVIRTDRFPLRSGEHHLPPLPAGPQAGPLLYEHGCGSPISPTAPTAVVAAAAEACRVIIDHHAGPQRLPATVIRTLTEAS
jgi:hypothetical protein